jgi:hypothetical protein
VDLVGCKTMLSRFFGRARKNNPLPLTEGASRAYEELRREGLPLARVAERHPLGAQAFFVDNLLSLGIVFGRPDSQSEPVKLLREKIATMALAGDKSGLGSEPGIRDLRVLPSELKRYLAWARTVQ